MYTIAFILFIAMLGITFMFTNVSVFAMFDFTTLFQLLAMLIPILIATRMEKDLLCALRIAVRKSASCSVRQLKRCEEAVSLTIKFSLCSGVLSFLMLLIIILNSVDPSDSAWRAIISTNFCTALLSAIYPLFLCCLLLPVRTKVRGQLIDTLHPEKQPL